MYNTTNGYPPFNTTGFGPQAGFFPGQYPYAQQPWSQSQTPWGQTPWNQSPWYQTPWNQYNTPQYGNGYGYNNTQPWSGGSNWNQPHNQFNGFNTGWNTGWNTPFSGFPGFSPAFFGYGYPWNFWNNQHAENAESDTGDQNAPQFAYPFGFPGFSPFGYYPTNGTPTSKAA